MNQLTTSGFYTSLHGASKDDLLTLAQLAADDLAENGGDALEAFALARKGTEFFKAFSEAVKPATDAQLQREGGKYTAAGVALSLGEATRYDYSNSPAWNLIEARIEALRDLQKLIETRAQKMQSAYAQRVGTPRIEQWPDPETGEVYDILPAVKSSTPTVKASVQ